MLKCESCNNYICKTCREGNIYCEACRRSICTQCNMAASKCVKCHRSICRGCTVVNKCINCLEYNIQNNIKISSLLGEGFSIIYEKYYNDDVRKEDFLSLFHRIGENKLICLGALKAGSDYLEVCAFGVSQNIFTQTTRNKTNKQGNVYWYFHENCIGFSPNEKIYLYDGGPDIEESEGSKRLSWGGISCEDCYYLENNRSGTNTGWNTNYKRIILKK